MCPSHTKTPIQPNRLGTWGEEGGVMWRGKIHVSWLRNLPLQMVSLVSSSCRLGYYVKNLHMTQRLDHHFYSSSMPHPTPQLGSGAQMLPRHLLLQWKHPAMPHSGSVEHTSTLFPAYPTNRKSALFHFINSSTWKKNQSQNVYEQKQTCPIFFSFFLSFFLFSGGCHQFYLIYMYQTWHSLINVLYFFGNAYSHCCGNFRSLKFQEVNTCIQLSPNTEKTLKIFNSKKAQNMAYIHKPHL